MDTSIKVNILLVDDEPANLLALEAILERLGQTLVKVTSGQDALRRLLEHDFAVILLDVQMPNLSGIEVAELIRERERSRHIPIIFLTGMVRTSEMMFKGYSAGAVDYLIKPIDPAVLQAKVSVFIELAQVREKLEAEVLQRGKIAAEVLQLNAALQQKNRDLEVANADLETFSYSVSHDLRTPLRHIVGYAEVLRDSAQQKLNPAEAKSLEKINQAARRMSTLIEDLLSFSRIGRADMTKGEVDMSYLVQETITEIAPDLEGRKIEWALSSLPKVQGDQSLLRQVWLNLICNAVKYSRPRNPARIGIASAACDGEITFQVTDNGVGFDMKDADRLFGVFSRLHSDEAFEGTGVGLANVKRIVQRHGGRIWATSVLNEGTIFSFALPTSTKT